jgi:hypothetical protein
MQLTDQQERVKELSDNLRKKLDGTITAAVADWRHELGGFHEDEAAGVLAALTTTVMEQLSAYTRDAREMKQYQVHWSEGLKMATEFHCALGAAFGVATFGESLPKERRHAGAQKAP